VNVFRG